MIANITKGNGFYGCVAYVLNKDDARFINSNMAGQTPAQLAYEFRCFSNQNERVERPVLHISLSPSPDDRLLDDWECIQIASELLSGLKLENNQFILVQHNDTEFDGEPRPHIHLVVNRVDYDGKCNDDFYDYYRTEKILRKIENEYDLIPQASSWEVENKKAYPQHLKSTEAGELNVVEKLQQSIKQAAADQPELPTFVARLLKQNIEVGCKFTRTDKLKGITYCIDGQWFKGGDLGNLYSHVGIRDKLKVNYKQDYQKSISDLIENYKSGITVDDGTSDSNSSDDSSSEPINNNSETITPQNTYPGRYPTMAEVFPAPTESKGEEESVESYRSNINADDATSENDSQEVPLPQNNYTSVVPSLPENFPNPPKSKGKEEIKNVTPSATIEIAPELQPTPPTIVRTTTQSTVNNDAAQYFQIISAYMIHKDKFEFKGDTLHAKLNTDNFQLTVKKVDTGEIILQGDYNLNKSLWNVTTDNLTAKEKQTIIKLKQLIPQQQQQRDTGMER